MSKVMLWYLLIITSVAEVHKRQILPRVSFSPESGGRVKPNNAILEIRTQGTIKLKK